MKKNSNEGSIKSITRATNVLVAMSHQLNRVSDIADEVKLSNSTVHRLLQALKASGWVIEDTLNHRYYIGQLMAKLTSNPLLTHQHLIRVSREKMEYLRDITGETVALHIRFGLERIRLEELPGKQNVTYIGQREVMDPNWARAHSKVLLSQIPQNELEDMLNKSKLRKLTANPTTDTTNLIHEVKKVKAQGYAISHGEETPGVAGISVPVWNYIEPASLTILGPEERFAPKMMNFLSELKKKAEEISQELTIIDISSRHRAN